MAGIFKTDIISLRSLTDKCVYFTIPSYQRPYVWQQEQISRLLNDCYTAFQFDPEVPYYLGTILTNYSDGQSQLIDGQQRFTTLWLIAVSLRHQGVLPEGGLESFIYCDKGRSTQRGGNGPRLRIDFEIRKEVSVYFEELLHHPEEISQKYETEIVEGKPYLANIVKAVATIKGILENLVDPYKESDVSPDDNLYRVKMAAFSDYLFTNVRMVKNVTPPQLDLNKLFATINNTGIQLEQTDIVKANLLKQINANKLEYSKIWECCENMGDFFERNVRKVFVKTDWNGLEPATFQDYDPNIFCLGTEVVNEVGAEAKSIQDIVSTGVINEQDATESQAEEEKTNAINCRSVLNFGQLLLHTNRLFLVLKGEPDFRETFHVNNLISIFKHLEWRGEEDIRFFFKLLWKVRYLFDAYFIKWIIDLDSKDEHLELTRVRRISREKQKDYFGREQISAKVEQLMLQSVLYFTGDYLRQYWITAYLAFLLEYHREKIEADPAMHIAVLEWIDNQMSLSALTDKEASFLLANKKSLAVDVDFEAYLLEKHGTSFRHYWFQKLDYILWKKYKDSLAYDEKFMGYRITSKNSVEHIYPQNPREFKVLDDVHLHSFGNLVLLNVSQNSEYGAKSVGEKRERFNTKQVYDSMKSYSIFRCQGKNGVWDEKSIIRHRDEMIGLIKGHYDMQHVESD